jgi:hypothetical protein
MQARQDKGKTEKIDQTLDNPHSHGERGFEQNIEGKNRKHTSS